MTYTVVPQGTGTQLVAAQTITGFASGGLVQASGATWSTGGVPVVRGDALIIAGSTSNNGTYIVLEVNSDTELEVYPQPTVEAAAGTAQVQGQNHKFEIEDEATTSATAIAAAVPDSRLFELVNTTPAINPDNSFKLYRFLFRLFEISHTGATATTMDSRHEVWFLNYEGRGAIPSTWTIRSGAADPGTFLLNVGNNFDPGDRRAVGQGSIFLNGYPVCDPAGQMEVRANASYIHSADATAATSMVFDSGQGTGHVVGCIIDGVASTPGPAGELDLIRNCIFAPVAGSAPFVPLGVVNNAADLLLTFATASGGVFFGAVEIAAAGVEVANNVVLINPIIIALASAFRFDDPKEDYTAQQLFFLSSGAGSKTYTFNPRFTDIDAVTGGKPIAGLEVTIIKLIDGHYVQVNTAAEGDYTLSIDGTTITYTASDTDTVTDIRNGLVTAINAAKADRQALATNNGGQVGGAADTLIINAVNADEPFAISVEEGDMTLDPAPAGAGALAADDYREGEIAGSPFTTDANGRINTDGVRLTRLIGYENGPIAVGFINCTYRVIVEGAGFAPYDRTFTPRATLLADIPIADAFMGAKNPGQ